MAELFENGIKGFTNENEFDAYFAPKNGQRANETNVGRAPKRVKKELNILKDIMSILLNRPVGEFDNTVTYAYGEIVSVKQTTSANDIFFTYFQSLKDDNLGVSPLGVDNLDKKTWSEVEPFSTQKIYNLDNSYINDVRLGDNAENSGYLIVGERYGNNVALDRNEIMARVYNKETLKTEASELILQGEGGDVVLHKYDHDFNKNAVTFKHNGYVGISTLVPEANLHIVGNSFILEESTNNLQKLKINSIGSDFNIKAEQKTLSLTSSNGIFLNETTGNVNVGVNNSYGSKLGVTGNVSIKRPVGENNSNYLLILEDSDINKSRLQLNGTSINSSSNNGTNKNLELQQAGGGILIHSKVASSSFGVGITDTGSVVVGKNLATGSMFNNTNKLEVFGNVYVDGVLSGLKKLTLGENDNGDELRFFRIEDRFNISAVTYNNSESDLYIQTGGKLIVNNSSIFSNGKLGIKKTPTADLDINGSFEVGGKSVFKNDITGVDIFSNTINGLNSNTLFIQTIGTDTKFNATTGTECVHIKDDGSIGVGYENPDYKLKVNGTSYISDDVTFAKDLKVSDELFVNHDTNTVSLGASSNTLGTDIQLSGTTSIKRDGGTNDQPLFMIENLGNRHRLEINGTSINSTDNGVKKTLGLQDSGGAICIHNLVTDKSQAISITDTGSIVIGKNLCSGQTMYDTKNKLEIYGDVYMSEGIKGMTDLKLGEFSGSDMLQFTKIEPNYHIDAVTNTNLPSTLYIQRKGADVIFNKKEDSSAVHITDDGRLGVGLINPTCKLSINGNACISSDTSIGGTLLVNNGLFINKNVVSLKEGSTDVLYISKTIAGSSVAKKVVINSTSDTDSQTVQISTTGKVGIRTTKDMETQGSSLIVKGNVQLFNDAETASIDIGTITGGFELSTSANTDLFINADVTDSTNTIIQGCTDSTFGVGGKLLVGHKNSLTELESNNIGNGFFKSEFSGNTLFTRNVTTTNGDAMVNALEDTEIVRIRRTPEEYIRLGGDFIQGVLGTEGGDAVNYYTTARSASILRLQPYGGYVQLGDATTVTTKVTLRTRGVIEATKFDGVATSAQYADLAERYEADDIYEVGTILSIGGDKEVTLGNDDLPLAGVVSENPAFRMNDKEENRRDNMPFIALKGRVPVKVVGEVKKGQYIVVYKDGKGIAVNKPENTLLIIGVALESSTTGIVEVKI